MQNFISFVTHHWELWLALAVILVLLVQKELSTRVHGVHLVSSQQLVALLNQQNARLFDLRERSLYDKGHIAQAVHVAREHAAQQIETKCTDKTVPLLLCDQSDQNALRLGALLKRKEYQYVGVLKGGIHAWLADSLPLVRGS